MGALTSWHSDHMLSGKPAVLKTQTIGLLSGTKFFSCAGDIRDGDCHIYKLLDDAILEEITLTKTKLGEIEGRLFELLTTVKEGSGDGQPLQGT
ncbi:unnamed protein product [Arabis nemorensis]|uniref:Uncharacterized protein n=1 Tax=Arabis nemorensis TaxID=586526 RepID=A0A565CEY8_9BRAS|nr:unnamed protein product [Arabis nemorensis]